MRIGVYYTHYQCLGHTARISSLVSSLKRLLPRSDIFSIQGSLPQAYLARHPFDRVYSLPFPYFSRQNFQKPFQAGPAMVEARARKCLSLIQRQSPDIFLTEYVPFGRTTCWSELFPSLAHLKRSRKKIFSSVGYPVMGDVIGQASEKFFSLYDRIFVHSPRMEMDYVAGTYPRGKQRRAYLDVFGRHEQLISFTNYIVPDPLPFLDAHDEPLALARGKVNVLVTRGGGAYCPEIILTALEAGDVLGPEFFLTLIAGPATTEDEWNSFQLALARKRVPNARLIRSTTAFESAIAASDVCVCPAPYNTSVLLMKYKKTAVLVPFEGSTFVKLHEQLARSRMLQDVMGCRVLLRPSLSARKLAREIKKALALRTGSRLIPAEWLKGKTQFIREFRKDAGLR